MSISGKYILFIFLFLSAFGCKEADPAPDTQDPNQDEQPTYSQYSTPFANVPATEDIVMYEVNLRAFSPGGDLQGVIDKLDHLQSLGVNVVWLMPVHPVGEVNSVNSPYSVKEYKEVSAEYGSLEDLRTLTEECHKRNMAVIMDWVANHTAWDHDWITNEDWYTQDASGDIVHPPGTNWQDVADLDFTNSEMRLAMIDAMKYWVLEANVDGYRCDYADGIPFDFWEQAIDTLTAIPGRDLVLLAEGTRNNHFAAGFDLTYGWDFYGALINVFNGASANKLYEVHKQVYSSIPDGKHRLRFTTNHDESAWEQTPMVFFNGKEGALTASVLAVYMGGVPLLYTGQEVGRRENVPFFSNSTINWNENPDMLQEYQALLQFYKQSEAAKKGSTTFYSNADVVSFKKTGNNEELVIIANIRDEQVNFTLPDRLQNTQWQDALSGNEVMLETSIPLDKYQYFILQK